MKSFGCLIIFFSTLAVIDAVAPSDFQITCRTHHSYRPLHDWIPYANDTSSGTWKVLIDQYDYQNLIGQFALPAGVWSVQDVDGDGKIFSHGGGGTCLYQIKIPNSYTNPNSNNWLFTQAVDYIDAVELIVNATVRFSACIQRRPAQPPCINDYVILHRYDTNTLSETQRINTANYQPYLNNSESSSRLGGDHNIIINRFRRPANFNYTYLGLQDIGSIGSVNRIFMYYEVCPKKVEGLTTYPEVPHPGQLPGASTRTTRLASCAEHSHNTTSLETYAYQDGRCEQSVTCVCDVGYAQNQAQCTPCAANMYRSALNSSTSCLVCPGNSSTSMMTASENCSCNAGHYRVTGSEGVGVGCTAPPPPITQCAVHQRFDTGVTIQWRTPAHCGGRSDCYYQVKINDGSPRQHRPGFRSDTQETYDINNLQPDTTYSITVSIHNGVSDQDPNNARLRECTIVATTIQGSVFMLGGVTYFNNTVVLLEDIDANTPLICTTVHTSCCTGGNSEQSKFYYPDGRPILTQNAASSSLQSLYMTRNQGSIDLRLQAGDRPPLGKYRCEIPDGRGTTQNLYIRIGTAQEPGVASTECPTVPDCPTQQPLTCPPEATPESIPDIHLPGRYRCARDSPDGEGTLQNLFITIGTAPEPESEHPTIASIPDSPTQPLTSTSGEVTEPESIPDIHFELNGVIFTNNSAVSLNDIGEGERALLCKTNLLNCCGTPPNRFGEFFYPSGDQVPIRIRGEGFYRNRGEQSVRLNRRDGTTSPTGRFHCEIPDAIGVMKSVYITIN